MAYNSIAFDSDERLNADMGRSCPISHSFSSASGQQAVQTVKATLADIGLNTLKTVYIDNSASPAPTVLTFGVSRQTLTAPPFSQGYYRVIGSPLDLDYSITNYSGAFSQVYTVNLLFINVALQPSVWICQPDNGPQGTSWCALNSTANTAQVLSSPPFPNRTTFVTGFSVSGGGATAGGLLTVTLLNIANYMGGTSLEYCINIPAGPTTAINPLIVNFPQPLQVASGYLTQLQVPAFGAGNTLQIANYYGFLV
jgi:hypothetical protein